jgi:hypothetical protein
VPDDAEYLEQHCGRCQDETDHQRGPGDPLATCLRCGDHHRVQAEDERISALVRRVREAEEATLARLRSGVVPSL